MTILPLAWRRNVPQGPIANRLWQFIGEQATTSDAAIN
jgi:hypothetical protein